jgi:LacI family transcriptional regulator
VYFQSKGAVFDVPSRPPHKNPAPRNPQARTGRWYLIMIVEVESAPGRSVLRGMGRYLREDRECRAAHIRPDNKDRGWVTDLKQMRPGAVIARIGDATLVAALRETGLPVVDIGGELPGLGFPIVRLDNPAIGRTMAEHLIERGFRRLAFIGMRGTQWSEDRRAGFIQAAALRGLTVAEQDSPYDPLPLQLDSSVRRRLQRWLLDLPKPVAIAACNDHAGRSVLGQCRELGLAVPEDVAVLGVDNDDLICETSDPTLSSVVADHFRIGYEAALIAERLARGGTPPEDLLLIEPRRVVTRASTDSIAVDDPHVSAAMQFIRLYACDGIEVDDVVAKVPVSRSVLQRRFRSVLGRSIHDIIVDTRLKRAKELLAETDLPLSTVAERSGITPQPYLNVVFKSHVGETPLSYRKRMAHVSDLERLI